MFWCMSCRECPFSLSRVVALCNLAIVACNDAFDRRLWPVSLTKGGVTGVHEECTDRSHAVQGVRVASALHKAHIVVFPELDDRLAICNFRVDLHSVQLLEVLCRGCDIRSGGNLPLGGELASAKGFSLVRNAVHESVRRKIVCVRLGPSDIIACQ